MPTLDTQRSLTSTVVALLRYSREAEDSFLRALTSAERDGEGAPEDPSPKVLVAHIAEFKQQQVLKVRAAAAGEAPPPLDAVEPTAPEVYRRLDDRTWTEAEQAAERVFSELTAEVERLSADDLSDPSRFPWLNGRPLCRQVLGRGLWHPLTHIRDFNTGHGREAEWRELQRGLTALTEQLDFVPVPGDGMSFYNLGCAFAASGERDKTIELLSQAVRNDAKYADYARDDSDLIALRDDSAFASLLRA
jgi:DinB superfamily